MTLSSIESVFSFVKNDGRQLPYEESSIGGFCFYIFETKDCFFTIYLAVVSSFSSAFGAVTV